MKYVKIFLLAIYYSLYFFKRNRNRYVNMAQNKWDFNILRRRQFWFFLKPLLDQNPGYATAWDPCVIREPDDDNLEPLIIFSDQGWVLMNPGNYLW